MRTIVDTYALDVGLEGPAVQVRSIGVNTPETSHPTRGVERFGKDATEAYRRLVDGQTVWLELDVEKYDQYRHLLAYVNVGDMMIKVKLACRGYAQVATFRPNVKSQELFLALQREEREAQRGWWRP